MQHQTPAFIDNPHAAEGVPPVQSLLWYGHMRFVHRQRARTLRKKGVPLRAYGAGLWVWYETDASYDERKMRRQLAGWMRSKAADRLFRESMNSTLQANFADIEARMYTLLTSYNPQNATGAALDALCNIPMRPAGMTDDEVRQLAHQGYFLRFGKMTPADIEARMAPPLELYCLGWESDGPFVAGTEDGVDSAGYDATLVRELRDVEGDE